MPTGEAIVQSSLLKIMNAEVAISKGHAHIENGRIQLRSDLDDSVKAVYSEGLRLWNPEIHDFNGYVKLVILSILRSFCKKNIVIFDEEKVSSVDAGVEVSSENLAILESFEKCVDSSELRAILSLIINKGYSVSDLMYELGLTRSQVEKRINKLVGLAESFSSRYDN